MRHLASCALALLLAHATGCGTELVDFARDAGVVARDIDVAESTATVSAVAAPDYALDMATLELLVDADDVIASVTGAATLDAADVRGQAYVVADAAGLLTYAALDAAFLATQSNNLGANIPAAAFRLVGEDLTSSQVRTLVIAHVVGDIRAYQSFEVTFHAE